jgi:hypothetical protein
MHDFENEAAALGEGQGGFDAEIASRGTEKRKAGIVGADDHTLNPATAFAAIQGATDVYCGRLVGGRRRECRVHRRR